MPQRASAKAARGVFAKEKTSMGSGNLGRASGANAF